MVKFPNTYGGKLLIAALHKYQLPDGGKLNILYSELRVTTNSESYRVLRLSDVQDKTINILVRSNCTSRSYARTSTAIS